MQAGGPPVSATLPASAQGQNGMEQLIWFEASRGHSRQRFNSANVLDFSVPWPSSEVLRSSMLLGLASFLLVFYSERLFDWQERLSEITQQYEAYEADAFLAGIAMALLAATARIGQGYWRAVQPSQNMRNSRSWRELTD